MREGIDGPAGRAKTAYGDTPKSAKTRIRDVRKAKGLTIAQLAARVSDLGEEVTAQGIQRWETQTRSISVERLLDVARALGVPAAELLPDTPRLSEEEQAMLEWWRSASSNERRALVALRHGLSESRQPDFQQRKTAR